MYNTLHAGYLETFSALEHRIKRYLHRNDSDLRVPGVQHCSRAAMHKETDR